MADFSQTIPNQRQIRLGVARLSLLMLSTAILTGGGLLGLASSAQAHHGGSHTIKVDKSGQAYEELGPNWNTMTAPVGTTGGLLLLGLGSYFIARRYSHKPKA